MEADYKEGGTTRLVINRRACLDDMRRSHPPNTNVSRCFIYTYSAFILDSAVTSTNKWPASPGLEFNGVITDLNAMFDYLNVSSEKRAPALMQQKTWIYSILLNQPGGRDETTPSNRHVPTSQARPSGTEIALQRSGEMYLVPVVINRSIAVKFMLDTGASDVSVPADVVLTLMRTGTLDESDFFGTQTYRLADGSTVPSATFRIRVLKVGDREIDNVTASVSDVKGPLLLGQSFLNRFKSWSINNDRRVLYLE